MTTTPVAAGPGLLQQRAGPGLVARGVEARGVDPVLTFDAPRRGPAPGVRLGPLGVVPGLREGGGRGDATEDGDQAYDAAESGDSARDATTSGDQAPRRWSVGRPGLRRCSVGRTAWSTCAHLPPTTAGRHRSHAASLLQIMMRPGCLGDSAELLRPYGASTRCTMLTEASPINRSASTASSAIERPVSS